MPVGFKVGDKVKNRTSGKEYTIVRIDPVNNNYTVENSYIRQTMDYSQLITFYIVKHEQLDLLPNNNPFFFEQKCSHNWTIYNSGWTLYEYCTHCNEKRGV